MCLKNNNIKFIDLWSEFTPNNVPIRALYKLNDSSGVHINEAGISVISDIILDYVKSPVEDEYTTPNTKITYQKFNIYPNFFRQTTIKNSQTDFETMVTLELIVLFDH
jgi:hypothetical protein